MSWENRGMLRALPPWSAGRRWRVRCTVLCGWVLPALLGWQWPWEAMAAGGVRSGEPFCRTELIFKPETWHNHGSCIVETPRGDLLVCWFHGSGERQADDVRIEGARWHKGGHAWSERFVMADTPGYPDTNCAMCVDPTGRLWLFWPTILANRWETALLKYRVSADYRRAGAPRWSTSEVLHVTPKAGFEEAVREWTTAARQTLAEPGFAEEMGTRVETHLKALERQAADKLSRRLGWMTRAHPFVLEGRRLIVPLYSDGFSFSLMAITDDWGATWTTSTPLVGAGNIQPSLVQRADGSLYTLMRDNGPPPKRLMQSESHDRGESWSPVTDTDIPNPGSGAEISRLRNGHWILLHNDTEKGRHSLLVQISDDEGRSWRWKRHLERDTPGPEAGAYHYPSVIQAADGTLHVSYSHHQPRRAAAGVAVPETGGKSIKHAWFNEKWVQEGDPR